MRALGRKGRLAQRTKGKTCQGFQRVTAIHHISPKDEFDSQSARNLCESQNGSQWDLAPHRDPDDRSLG
jgi:hypothetical protein